MLFNSGQFLIFFPVVIVLYFLFPHRLRWVFLLAASYFFYMCWRWEYVFLILGSTVADYFIAKEIHRRRQARSASGDPEQPGDKSGRGLLWLSILINLGVLFSFKYLNFFTASAAGLADLAGLGFSPPVLEVLLPVGISFYTFQTMSYTIDVYNGKVEPEKHFGIFALFVSFWPQLVAGPIERSGRLLPQFRKEMHFDAQRVIWGMNRMAYGFFKKVVVADRLAIYVNEVYDKPEEFGTITLVLATVFFAFQIYCDFSGYTDIAIGVAAIMGFRLMENFDRPYLSRSIGEFWRRWHISLSTWFRDYVYIPLGGNRVLVWRWYYNLFLTFVVSGLWHGADWTFVVWGGLHGLYMVWERVSEPLRHRLYRGMGLGKVAGLVRLGQLLATFFLVTVAWVFFRAEGMAEALAVFRGIARLDLGLNPSLLMAYQGFYNFALSLGAIGLLGLSYFLPKDLRLRHSLLFILGVTLLILLFGKGGEAQFIYFQF